MWRALKNALPVGVLLATRGIQAELNCKRCGELESISHLFLSCPFAVEFWKKVPIHASGLGEAELENLRDWLTAFVKSPSLPPVGLLSSPLIPWLLWNLWTARNKLVFEGKSFLEEDIISKSIVEAKAWEEANVKEAKHQKKRTPVCKNPIDSPSCWCDGAWQESTKAGGMGWIIKNTEGEVICRGSSNRFFVSSALMAEALAMREALKKAKDSKLQSLQILSDSQVLVLALREGRDMNEIAGVLQDIRNLATLFCPISFTFVPRLENLQADALASSGLNRLLVET